MLEPSAINITAVVVSAIVNLAIGAIWYSPILFANPWSDMLGRDIKQMRGKNATQGYISASLASLVMSYVFALVIYKVGARDVVSGATIGFWLWTGFIATTTMVDYVFAGHRKKLYLINVGYPLVAMIVMGAILASWN